MLHECGLINDKKKYWESGDGLNGGNLNLYGPQATPPLQSLIDR